MSGAARRLARWAKIRDRITPGRPLVIAGLDGGTGGERVEDLLLDAVERGEITLKPGTVQHHFILHDAWCPTLRGRGDACRCSPEIVRNRGEAA